MTPRYDYDVRGGLACNSSAVHTCLLMRYGFGISRVLFRIKPTCTFAKYKYNFARGAAARGRGARAAGPGAAGAPPRPRPPRDDMCDAQISIYDTLYVFPLWANHTLKRRQKF